MQLSEADIKVSSRSLSNGVGMLWQNCRFIAACLVAYYPRHYAESVS